MKNEEWAQHIWQQYGTILLGLVTLALFVVVVNSAVNLAFSAETFPATATIPSDLASDAAFVSDKAGVVEFVRDEESAEIINIGDRLGDAGVPAVRVVGSGYLRLGLANGDFIFLDDNSGVRLRELSEPFAITELNLSYGSVLIDNPNDSRNIRLWLDNSLNIVPHGDSLLGVSFDIDEALATIDCLRGVCDIQSELTETVLRLTTGRSVRVNGDFSIQEAGSVAVEGYRSFGAGNLIPTATVPRRQPSNTPQLPTSTALPPTATAAPIATASPTSPSTATLSPTATLLVTATPTLSATRAITSTLVPSVTVTSTVLITPAATTISPVPPLTATATLTTPIVPTLALPTATTEGSP